MPTAAALRFALLALWVAGEVEGSAEANIATLRKWAEVGQKMTEISDEAKMAGYAKELASMTAPKMVCAFAPGTAIGFDLRDVSIGDCLAAISSRWVGLRQSESELVSVAVVPDSGGKTILSEWRSTLGGVTSIGAAVPLSTFSFRDVGRYDFDDAGLIVGMTLFGDDGVVDAIQQKVREWPAKRNAAATMEFGGAFRRLNGEMVSPEAWAGISGEFASLTAPKMACAWSPGLETGFDLKEVSVGDCLKALGSTCPGCNVKVVSQEISSVAVDPTNGGRTTIAEWKSVLGLPSGARLSLRDVMRLDFDDDGRVAALTVIGDDGVMAALRGQAEALASPGIPGGPLAATCGTALIWMAVGAAVGAWALAGRRGVREPAPLLG